MVTPSEECGPGGESMARHREKRPAVAPEPYGTILRLASMGQRTSPTETPTESPTGTPTEGAQHHYG